MFQRLDDAIAGEASGEIACGSVVSIAQHHRIQASPGYRAAAEWAADILRAAGVQTEIESCPATSNYWRARGISLVPVSPSAR